MQTGCVEVITSGLTLDDFYLAPNVKAYLATNREIGCLRFCPSGMYISLLAG